VEDQKKADRSNRDVDIPKGCDKRDEVANAALYPASDEADIVAGICINVDG